MRKRHTVGKHTLPEQRCRMLECTAFQAHRSFFSGTLPHGKMFGKKLAVLALSRAAFSGSTDALQNGTELSTLLLSTNRWVCDAHPQNARHLSEGLFTAPDDLVKKKVGYKLQSVDRVFASNPWDKPEMTQNRIAAFSGNLALTGNLAA